MYKEFTNIKETAILVPHADDELIGTYKFMQNNSEKIQLFYSNWIGSSDDEGVRETRKKEFEKLCGIMNLKFFVSSSWEKDFTHFLLENEFDSIMLPSPVDWHKEHRLINYMANRCLNKCSDGKKYKIILYGVTVPIITNQMVGIELSKEDLENKYNIFKQVYVSQKHMPIERLKYQERLNGEIIKKYSAENYLELTYDEWEELLSIVREKEFFLDELKTEINDIYRIRRISIGCYKDYRKRKVMKE